VSLIDAIEAPFFSNPNQRRSVTQILTIAGSERNRGLPTPGATALG
jgi:hypothetical protein